MWKAHFALDMFRTLFWGPTLKMTNRPLYINWENSEFVAFPHPLIASFVVGKPTTLRKYAFDKSPYCFSIVYSG